MLKCQHNMLLSINSNLLSAIDDRRLLQHVKVPTQYAANNVLLLIIDSNDDSMCLVYSALLADDVSNSF